MKRMLLLLATAATSATMLATSAQAAVVTDDTSSQPWSGWVSCANGGAGELVSGTISVRTLMTATVNANGDSWQFQFQPRGTLTGQVTGDTYRVTGVTRGSFNEAQQGEQYVATYVNNFALIGPGPDNNLRVHEVEHVTISGDDVVVQHDDLRVACA